MARAVDFLLSNMGRASAEPPREAMGKPPQRPREFRPARYSVREGGAMSFQSRRGRQCMTTTHVLATPEADIAYDVDGPLPAADGRPPLLMVGQPMTASGFRTLASHLPDRTVVPYAPR